jgi:hypothetical protein
MAAEPSPPDCGVDFKLSVPASRQVWLYIVVITEDANG